MKRWTSTWAAVMVAGFLAVPGTGQAQSPAAPAQTPAAPTAATTPAKAEQGTPQEHLQKADAALNSISASAVSGKAKGQIADLKKRVSNLEKIAEKSPAGDAAAADPGKSTAKWTKETAAADKIIAELLADAPATAAADASATATATAPGQPKPAGTSGTMPSKAPAALDEDTKAKLATVRASLTAYAAAMSGSASAPAAKSPSEEPAAAAPTASRAAPTTPPAEPTPATPPTTSPAEPKPAAPSTSPTTPPAEPTPATPPTTPPAEPKPATPSTSPTTPPAEPTPATPPTTPAEPAPTTPPSSPSPQPSTQPPAQPSEPGQPPATTTPAPTAASAQAKPEVETAKRALTEARDSLAQMTQLPAAQQLTGETRTQMTQLISAFNELITTNTEWKASYAKVDGILTSLIGAQTADESAPAPATAAAAATPPAATPPAATPPAAGTAGAVGTSGTATGALDPGIKAKLLEFRTHLKEFEKAAGADKK